MMKHMILAFIPIFFAMDPVGLLPIFSGLTQDLSRQQKNRIIAQSLFTALALAVVFIFFGKIIFRLLGITIEDFMIAGGIILFCLSILDLTQSRKYDSRSIDELGAVPIGTPLVVGPGVLTISLMMNDLYGIKATLAAICLNIFIVGVVFILSDRLMSLLGKAGSRALSKVMAILLGAIGIMMIRKGIVEIILIFNK